jgi:short-subunit dehydrogenase
MKNNRAHIINISSLLSQYPVAYKTVYPASKAFIYSFSLGLREELKNSPVKVSVALPGGMLTNKDVSLRLQRENWIAQAAILSPEEVAQTILDQAFRGKKVIIPGLINKFFWGLMKVIPCRLGIPLLSDIYRKEISNPEEHADTFPATEINLDPDLVVGKKSPIGFLHPSDRSNHPLAREPAVEEHHETV